MITIKDENRAKIKLKEINFQLNDNKSTEMFVESLDYFPLVYISKINDPIQPPVDGVTIDPKDIIYVKLHNSKFLPEIELYCNDTLGVLFNDFYPFDHDTILSIFVKSNSESVLPIRMDFRVAEFQTTQKSENNSNISYLIKGILDVDELHYTYYESNKGTSYDVIKNLALRINLGFASNIENSNDDMTWINPCNTYTNYIKEITKYSFISETSFVWTFIDFYYNINYIDVQLELNEFFKNEQHITNVPNLLKNEDDKIVPLYLSNNKALQGTNQYFNKYEIVNQSFKVNLEINYQFKATWFDKNENAIYKKLLNKLETDEDKLGNNLVQLSDKNSKIYQGNINDEYFIGKVDTNKNVHKNYPLAKVMNKYNLDSMEKMKLIITLNHINFSIKRFQNLKIEIFEDNLLYSRDANTKKPLNNVNPKLSGFWFVTGINYLYKRSGGVEQEIILMRRDLNLNYGDGNDEKHDISLKTSNIKK